MFRNSFPHLLDLIGKMGYKTVMAVLREQKIWCLVNKKTGRIIKIDVDVGSLAIEWITAIGFETKKGALSACKEIEYDEEIRRFKVVEI